MTRPDPADESKLIDLRQLGALIGPNAGLPVPKASESALALPSFGGNQLRTPPRPLVAQPQYLPPAPPPVIAPTRASGDTTVLLVMICGLAFVVLGLTFYVVLIQAPRTVIQHETVVAAAAAGDSTETPEPEADRAAATPEDNEAEDDEDVPDPTDEVEPTEDTAPTEAELAALETDAPRTRTPKRTRDRDRNPIEAPEKRTKPTPPPTKTTNELSPECIIDPASCGLGAKPGKPAKPGTAPKPGSPPTNNSKGEALPKKLSQAQVRDGIAPVKSAAKSCRAKHGGAAGESVVVKLTIQGSSGRVTSAAPVAPHAGTPLGGCVAGALKQATFGRFEAAVQGVQYGVRL